MTKYKEEYNIRWCQRCEEEKDFTSQTLRKEFSKHSIFINSVLINVDYNLDMCPECLVRVHLNLDKDFQIAHKKIINEMYMNGSNAFMSLFMNDKKLIDPYALLAKLPTKEDKK